MEFDGHRLYFRLLREKLWYASPGLRVASGLVPDGFSHRVVASNPRAFSLLATRVAVRSMVESPRPTIIIKSRFSSPASNHSPCGCQE